MMVTERTDVADTALPLARFREHLRLGSGFADDGLQDALLTGFLRAALAAIEARTGKALIEREFEWDVTCWRDPSGATFPLAPVGAVVSAELAGDDIAPLLRLQPDLSAPRLCPVGSALPVIASGQQARIRFRAGFGAEFGDLPADLQQAVLLLAAHYYEYRDETALGAGCMPFGVSALIERYRPIRIGVGA